MARSKKEIGEGIIFTITNYIFWFFLGNLYFLVMNIPLVIILFIYLSNGAKPLPAELSPIIIICCISIGPSATALLSVMGKLIREKDISITKDFFKAYKDNFFQSLFFWALELIIICVLYTDIRFLILSRYPLALTIFIFIVMTFTFLVSLYVFPIISRFYLGTKYIIKTAAYYTIRKFHITIMSFASFLAVGFVFIKISSFILLFVSSIVCYLIMFYQRNILLEIEENFKKDDVSVHE